MRSPAQPSTSARLDAPRAPEPVVLALTDFVTLIFYFNAAGWLYGGVR